MDESVQYVMQNKIYLAVKYMQNKPRHKLFEYATAIEHGGVVWEDLHSSIKDAHEWFHYDTGIDVYDRLTDTSMQCKYYTSATRIAWDDIAKFLATSFLFPIQVSRGLLVSNENTDVTKVLMKRYEHITMSEERFNSIIQDAISTYESFLAFKKG